MELNIKHFIAILFVLTIVATFSLKPHRIEVVSKKGVAQVKFIDFKSYEITPRGVEAWLKGALGEKFGEKLHVTQLKMKRLTPAGIELAMAREAIMDDHRTIDLYENVHLSRSDGWLFETAKLRYDMRRKLYTTDGAPFVAYYGKSVVKGKNLIYRVNSGKITAEKIRADIYEVRREH